MICPGCGKKTLFDVVTCGRCGHDFAARAAEEHAALAVGAIAPPPTAPGTITSDAPPPDATTSGAKIFGGAALVIFGIGITAMMYSDAEATGGGRVYAPVGLIAWGVLLVIRGLAGR